MIEPVHAEIEPVHAEKNLVAERRLKLSRLRKRGCHNGHPNNFRRDSLAVWLEGTYGNKNKEELEKERLVVSVAGRVMAKRGPFVVVQDMTGRIQAYASKETQKSLKELGGLDIGDIIGVRGILQRSGRGHLYVNMDEFELLTKAIRPLPDKFHGLVNQEQRHRQRYVDLIVNEQSRQTFQLRSKIVAAIRHFMTISDFMEVETPMMQVIPGGASARPFVTHHNKLDIDMYLRISPELYLKRLVVGGFERVFEINRSFRNEGLSLRHNPEFTMMEFYMAYADYHDLIDLTEKMLKQVTQRVLGTNLVRYGEEEFDFGSHYARLSVLNAVKQFNPWNSDIQSLDNNKIQDKAIMETIAKDLNISIKDYWGSGRLLTEIFEETVEHHLIQPTFITEYPTEVSPLARRNDENPFITDRFEFFVGGCEIANGFSELNDAEDQEQRFKEQAAVKDSSNDEVMFYDSDYITALEYGLPPTAGQGIGIDRLSMLLTNSNTIRDVLLFPAMRPQQKD